MNIVLNSTIRVKGYLHQRNGSLDSVLQKIPEMDDCIETVELKTKEHCIPLLKPCLSLSDTFNCQNQIYRFKNGSLTTEHFQFSSSENSEFKDENSIDSTFKPDQISMGSVDSGICNSDACFDDGSAQFSVCDSRSSLEYLSNDNIDYSDCKYKSNIISFGNIYSCYESCEGQHLAQTHKGKDSNLIEVFGLKSKTVHASVKCNNQTSSWLLRLFESKLFSMSMALHYLFKSKEPGVLAYIGNKLFEFPVEETNFYLPQLVNMYIQIDEVAEAIHPFFVHRCGTSPDFSLQLVCLLNAFSADVNLTFKNKSSDCKLRKNILSDYFRPKIETSEKICNNDFSSVSHSVLQAPFHRCHQRSKSDNNMRKNKNLDHQKLKQSTFLGDLNSGRAFDNGCVCFNNNMKLLNNSKNAKCSCEAKQILPRWEFIKALINIGSLLNSLPNKDSRTERLLSELSLINFNLPAYVYPPIHDNNETLHCVLRIPPQGAVMLNSKERAPFFLCLETVEIYNDDVHTSHISPLLRTVHSEENLHSGFIHDEEDVWIIEDDKLSHQYLQIKNKFDKDRIGKISQENINSNVDSYSVTASIIRQRLVENLAPPRTFFLPDPIDPSAAALKEPWNEKLKRIRQSSPYNHIPNWHLSPLIVKYGDDLRQELLVYQLLVTFKQIWSEEHVSMWLQPYHVFVFSNNAGLIEPIVNAVSLHQIKRNCHFSLKDYFFQEHGPPTSENFLNAQRNFVESCAGYCLVCYLIQVKDRHNSNILLDNEGHIIHIDFGFILSSSPRNLGFESSPFKLTSEFVDVMGGPKSDMFEYFKILMLKGLLAARKHSDRLMILLETLCCGSQLPCFKSGIAVIQAMKNRFHMNLTEQQLRQQLDMMIEGSIHSLTTKLYDNFQYYANGIL